MTQLGSLGVFRMVLHFFTAFLLLLQAYVSPYFTVTPPHTATGIVWATTTGVTTHVVDGDTIDVRLENSEVVRVRYIGMNSPEIYPTVECGGASSTARNHELVGGKTVTLVPGPGLYDTYGRRLAYVYVGDTFVNETLVAEGWAELMMIPPNTSYRDSFEILTTTARSKAAGIWTCSSHLLSR